MNRYERLNGILELVADRGRIDVDALAGELEVSTATIRRDLDHLAQQQFLTRTRGGAVAHGVAYDLPLRYKTSRRATAKQRIGRAAAELVTAGMVVGLNGGTTATEVARAIATRADLQTSAQHAGSGPAIRPVDQAVTVVTNAVNIAGELTIRPHIKIVVTGGVARQQSYELARPLARHILSDVSLDIAFLGVDAIDLDAGATAHHEGEASINDLMASRARRVVVIADSSKVGAHAFARIRPIGDVDLLITDRGITADAVRAFEDADVEVLAV